MQTAEKPAPKDPAPIPPDIVRQTSPRRYLGVFSLLFAFLQAVCPAFVALGAVRVFLGTGALALAAGAAPALKVWHGDAIRIPMLLLAALGASLNLFVVWQIRRLRARPAARWRVTPPTAATLRSERWQIALSLLTFACIAIEETLHIHFHGV